jgi:L-gulono-1,4-lactone dehydrogenase
MSGGLKCAPTAWVNWSGTQRMCPTKLYQPCNLGELREAVAEVEGRSGQLKPVATGLSFSDILQTDDALLETTGLLASEDGCVLMPLDSDLWRGVPPEPLVRIPCGASIRSLNAALAEKKLAFTNLGGYDMQTMVGAISTSTHGSGVELPPLCDAVRSLDLLTSGGVVYRIEPTGGLTDRDKFRHRYGDQFQLLQSDDVFWACVVSLGCLGIITSVVMEVSHAYLLEETVRLRLWSEVRRELETGAPLRRFRNYEVLITPYPRRDGDYDCLVTQRGIAAPHEQRHPSDAARRSLESTTFLASTQRELLKLMHTRPRMIPALLRTGFEALQTGKHPRVDHSYVVYNVGKINTVEVMSGEYFFPIAGQRYLHAVESLLALVLKNARHEIYQPSPIALRFVRGSCAPLSMARGEPHAALEIACFSGLPWAGTALLSYEQACIELGGRPHWGQLQELTGRSGWLRQAYPDAQLWLDAVARFNGSGIFNNHFTDRLGISQPS